MDLRSLSQSRSGHGTPWEGVHPGSAELRQQLTTDASMSLPETRRTTQLSPAQIAGLQSRELSK